MPRDTTIVPCSPVRSGLPQGKADHSPIARLPWKVKWLSAFPLSG
jgi:hypothetical protein